MCIHTLWCLLRHMSLRPILFSCRVWRVGKDTYFIYGKPRIDPSWTPLGKVTHLLACLTKRLTSPYFTTFFMRMWHNILLKCTMSTAWDHLGTLCSAGNIWMSMWKYPENREQGQTYIHPLIFTKSYNKYRFSYVPRAVAALVTQR